MYMSQDRGMDIASTYTASAPPSLSLPPPLSIPLSFPLSLRPKKSGHVDEGGAVFSGSGQKKVRVQQEEERRGEEGVR